jgi:hypothetical protein
MISPPQTVMMVTRSSKNALKEGTKLSTDTEVLSDWPSNVEGTPLNKSLQRGEIE